MSIKNSNTNNQNYHSNDQEPEGLITHEPLPGTPFAVTGNQEKGYFLRLGMHRLTEFYETKEDAINQLYEEQWNMISKLIITINELDKKGDIDKMKKEIQENDPN